MGVPVPFGQFVPGESPVHVADARVKIALTFAYTVALFAIDSWLGLAATAAIAIAVLGASRVPVSLAARGLVPVLWLLAFTLLANSLMPASRSEPLVSVGPLIVDSRGLFTGLFFAVRIILLVLGTSLITLTTSPVALTDGLSLLMSPLRYVRFPVDDAAMMMSIALRFMPTTAEEAERIVVAQVARGADFGTGGPVRRARAWLPVLVPLFVRLFRRADDLAIAMEARCYRGEGRTRLRESRMGGSDWAALVVGVALTMALVVIG